MKTHQVEGSNAQLDSALELSERTRLVGNIFGDIQQVLTVPVGEHERRRHMSGVDETCGEHLDQNPAVTCTEVFV